MIMIFSLRFNNFKIQFRNCCKCESSGTIHIVRVIYQAGLFDHFSQDGHNVNHFGNFKLSTFLPIEENDRSVSVFQY